jgi:hypothetical protein
LVKKGKSSDAKKIKEAQILLKSDENVKRKSSTLLSQIVEVSIKTFESVRRRFCKGGMAMLETKPREIRSDKQIDGRVESHLTTLLCQSRTNKKPKWALKKFADSLFELEVIDHLSKTEVESLIKKSIKAISKETMGQTGRKKHTFCVSDGTSFKCI